MEGERYNKGETQQQQQEAEMVCCDTRGGEAFGLYTTH